MEIPWPKTKDRLFKGGGSGALWAHTLSNVRDIGLLAAGYKQSGDVLIEHLAKHGRNDGLVLPILFCYRQYLELRLKDIISKVHTFEETGDSFRRNHDISELWDIMKAKALSEASEEEESFEIVEGCLMEFHSLDNRALHSDIQSA